jgi:hypothetical protein
VAAADHGRRGQRRGRPRARLMGRVSLGY